MTAQLTRKYFEEGCLCVLTKRMPVDYNESDEIAATRYMKDCKCSRGINKYDVVYDKQLRAEYLKGN